MLNSFFRISTHRERERFRLDRLRDRLRFELKYVKTFKHINLHITILVKYKTCYEESIDLHR